MKTHQLAIAWLGSILLLSSCSHRNDIKAEAPPKADTAVIHSDFKQDHASTELSHYIVKKGDCLWRIAAKPSVLGDPFRWILLYKQNRDEIDNPDLIQPRQDLSYSKRYSSGEISQAIEQADAWPAYQVPRRASLPNPLPLKD
jgi:hypothetical protein